MVKTHSVKLLERASQLAGSSRQRPNGSVVRIASNGRPTSPADADGISLTGCLEASIHALYEGVGCAWPIRRSKASVVVACDARR